jgi:hypothetical protein
MFVLSKRWTFLGVSLLVVGGAALRFIHLFQSGFIPDEEITWFAAHGIKEHFAPVLPSGIIYDRGIPYSYLAWFAGIFFGQTIFAYRIISFISGLAAIVVAFFIGRKAFNNQVGFMAAAFVAFTPWAILISDWARFYSLFLTFALLTSLAYFSQRKFEYLLFLIITCLLHESGIILALFPLFQFIIQGRKDFLKLTTFAVACALLVFIAKGLFIASAARKQYLNLYEERTLIAAPLSHLEFKNLPAIVAVLACAVVLLWVMNRKGLKVPIWWAAAIAICASILLQGVALVICAFSSLLNPSRKNIYIIFTIGLVAISVLIWVFQTSIHFGISSFSERFFSLLSYGLAFPLSSLKYFVTHWPIFSIFGLFAVVFAVNSSSLKEVNVLLACIALASVVFISLVQVPLQPRFFLLGSIFTFIVVSIAITRWKKTYGWIFACLILFAVLGEQYFALEESVLLHLEQDRSGPLAMELRTFQIEDEQQLVKSVQSSDIIISNDELASLYFLGRCDFWVLPGSRYFNRFQFTSGNTLRGWYGGSQVLASLQGLKPIIQKEPNKRFLLILFNTAKFGGNRNEILQAFRNAFKNVLVFGSESESILILRLDS